MPVSAQLGHLLARSWLAMVAETSTNTLGLAIWTVGLAACGWLAKRLSLLFRHRQLPRKERLTKALEDGLHDAITEAFAIVILVLITWAAFVPVVVYRDHQLLRKENARLQREKQELTASLHEKNRGITGTDPAYMGLVQILRQFQGYSMRGKPCTIVFTAEPDSAALAQAMAETSALVSGCNTFGPDATGMPDSIENKKEGMIPGVIVVHAKADNRAAIIFQRSFPLPTRYSYVLPRNPHFAVNGDVMWLQFGSGVGWSQ